MKQVEVAYSHGLDIGIGVASSSGSPMGKAVKGSVDGVEYALGSTSQFEISRITSTSDLEQVLGIDADASYGIGLFNASARFAFAKNAHVQTESLFMAITARVTLSFLQVDNPVLEDEAAALVDRPDVFATRYGDMFVRGVSRGGLFVGILRLDTDSKEEAESIVTELKGSYGLFSAEAKVKFENVQKSRSSRLSISVYREGGPVDDTLDDITNPLSLYALFQKWVKSFKDEPVKSAVPYLVTLAPTSIATGPLPPNAIDRQHAQDILVLCARARSATLDRYNLLDYIVNNPGRYDFTASSLDDVVTALNGCQADLDLIAQAASNAMDHPEAAKTPAEFAAEKNKKYPTGLLPAAMPVAKEAVTLPPTDVVLPGSGALPAPPSSPPISDQRAMQWFMAVGAHRGDAGGIYPTFSATPNTRGSGFLLGSVFIDSRAAEARDVAIGDLGNPSLEDFGARMRAANAFAHSQGFTGGFPTYYHADYGSGVVCGTVMLKKEAAEFRDILLSDLNITLENYADRFIAVHNFAKTQGFVSGFPTFYHGEHNGNIVCGAILIKSEYARWADVIVERMP